MLRGNAPVSMATLEINVTHIVNVIQMGLLVSNVLPMEVAFVKMVTMAKNAVNVLMNIIGPKVANAYNQVSSIFIYCSTIIF